MAILPVDEYWFQYEACSTTAWYVGATHAIYEKEVRPPFVWFEKQPVRTPALWTLINVVRPLAKARRWLQLLQRRI